jgi:plasmid maintenance system killer protein
MITKFKHIGLESLFNRGPGTAQTPAQNLHNSCIRRLDAIDQARNPAALNVPGFNYQPHPSTAPARHSVNADRTVGNRIEFAWIVRDAEDVDYV